MGGSSHGRVEAGEGIVPSLLRQKPLLSLTARSYVSAPVPDSLWSELRQRVPFVLVVALSTAWVVFVLAYLARMGMSVVVALPIGELSSLIVAVATPVLALWLVVAVFSQRGELSDLRRRLGEMTAQSRHSLQQSEVQSRAMLEMEAQLKRSLSADTRRLALQDLASQAAVVGERLGILKPDTVDVAWARFGSGDIGAFVQPFLNFMGEHPDLAERMGEAVHRDTVARAALAGFVRRYDRLTSGMTDDKLGLETLDEGPLGRGYKLFKAAEAHALKDPSPMDDV
jgi:hypothetical protein